jgi:enoyl-CoA hydratase
MPISLSFTEPSAQGARSAHMLLSRPHARNAVDLSTIDAFERHLDALEPLTDLAAVVFSTHGDASFIAGGDLKAFHSLTTPEDAASMSDRMRAVLDRFEALPCPVIAAIDGHAYGGGAELLLACDVRFAHARATLCFSQLRFALSPGWGGAARLRDHVGRQRALYALLSMTPIPAADALQWGLVEVVTDTPALDAALAFAHHLRAQNLHAVRSLKRALRSPADEAATFLDLWTAPDHAAAVQAFLSSRRPSAL